MQNPKGSLLTTLRMDLLSSLSVRQAKIAKIIWAKLRMGTAGKPVVATYRVFSGLHKVSLCEWDIAITLLICIDIVDLFIEHHGDYNLSTTTVTNLY